MQYLAGEDSQAIKKIGINVAVLVAVAFALVALSALLS